MSKAGKTVYFRPVFVFIAEISHNLVRRLLVLLKALLSFQPPSPAASTVSMLNDDTTDLIERLADVQQEKWLLEEKVCTEQESSSLKLR